MAEGDLHTIEGGRLRVNKTPFGVYAQRLAHWAWAAWPANGTCIASGLGQATPLCFGTPTSGSVRALTSDMSIRGGKDLLGLRS